MKVESAFLRLFRQSRYARSVGAEEAQPKQDRRELFAVAGAVFVTTHDPKFMRDFLADVGSVAAEDIGHGFEMTLLRLRILLGPT